MLTLILAWVVTQAGKMLYTRHRLGRYLAQAFFALVDIGIVAIWIHLGSSYNVHNVHPGVIIVWLLFLFLFVLLCAKQIRQASCR
jgi:hypothetical protein